MQQKIDKRRKYYTQLVKNTTLAELIGIILGDGHVHKFPRTDRLVITCGSKKNKYIRRIVSIVTNVFGKQPSVLKRKAENTSDISLYQGKLEERLAIPAGNKIKNNVGIPEWIKRNKDYVIYCLKGLFETDGCFQKDHDNYAQYIELKNFCNQIRLDTYEVLKKIGYHPQINTTYVRLAKRQEVYSFKELISFRKY